MSPRPQFRYLIGALPLVLPLALALQVGCSGDSHGRDWPAAVAPQAPKLSSQPLDLMVLSGSNASFSVAVSGVPTVNLQWERSFDDTTWQSVPGATGSTFTFAAKGTDNGWRYRVVAKNSEGSVTSGSALLRVDVAPSSSFALPGGISLDLVSIPAGSYQMGGSRLAEVPVHPVSVSAFAMAKFLTTQAQWAALMGSNPSTFTSSAQRPVEGVSYQDIAAPGGFLEKLNAATEGKRPAGKVFRLATEAEWEYAARGGSAFGYYWGADSSLIGDYAWTGLNTVGTQPVGGKIPNAFGLFDMSGNVWQWCGDAFGVYADGPQADPVAAGSEIRVLRGGSYNDYDCQTATRNYGGSTARNPFYGFRVVLGDPRSF